MNEREVIQFVRLVEYVKIILNSPLPANKWETIKPN